jgi:epoxyqueuosine reductase
VLLEARPAMAQLSLREILQLTPERFAAVFKGTAVKRLKLRGLLRNACIVAANLRASDCLEELVRLALEHPEPMVRAHAVWAVGELDETERLQETVGFAHESDPLVLAEYDAL